MPSIAHLFMGGIIGYLLYRISNGKFTGRHAFILFMNNYLGPDVGWALGIGNFTHTVIGYALFAPILTAVYTYMAGFTVDMKKFMPIRRPITVKNGADSTKLDGPGFVSVYCTVLAGGLMHQYLDGLLNYGGVFFMLPLGGDLLKVTLTDFITLWRKPQLPEVGMVAVIGGIGFIIGMIYVYITVFKKYSESAYYLPVFLILLYLIPFLFGFYVFGDYFTAYHADAGAIFYILLYWIAPFFLCTLACDPRIMKIGSFTVEKTNVAENSGREFKPRKNNKPNSARIILGIPAIILIISAIAMLTLPGTYVMKRLAELSGIAYGTYPGYTIFPPMFSVSAILFGIFCLYNALETDLEWKEAVIWVYLISGAFIGITAIICTGLLGEPIISYLFNRYGYRITPYFDRSEIYGLIPLFSTVLLILSVLNILSALGITGKNGSRVNLYKLAIYYQEAQLITVIGGAVACYLASTLSNNNRAIKH